MEKLTITDIWSYLNTRKGDIQNLKHISLQKQKTWYSRFQQRKAADSPYKWFTSIEQPLHGFKQQYRKSSYGQRFYSFSSKKGIQKKTLAEPVSVQQARPYQSQISYQPRSTMPLKYRMSTYVAPGKSMNRWQKKYYGVGRYAPKGKYQAMEARSYPGVRPLAMVNAFNRVEKKQRDTELASTAMVINWADNGALIKFLSMPVQGTDKFKRDGKFISITQVQMSIRVEEPALASQSVPTPDTSCKLALVWNKQTNGTALVPKDVYQSLTGPEIQSMRNLLFTKKYKVLRVFNITLPVSQANTNEGGAALYDSAAVLSEALEYIWKPKTPLRVEFTVSASGDVSDVLDHSFSLIGVSNKTSTLVFGTFRIRFTSA